MTRILTCILFFISATSMAQGTWTWMKGNSPVVWGTMGVPSPSNTPPQLYEPAEWTDQQGNFWIYGGVTMSNGDHYAALWKFDPVANMWTWMGPSSLPNTAAVYGTQGVPAPANNPGARSYASASWVDQQGNLWLFGGDAYDITGTYGTMNDLWMYNIATNMWTWMRGSPTANTSGSYGTIMVPAASNEPPSRTESAGGWVSSNGDLWMYGGRSFSGSDMSDMWKYNIATNMWTWMHGAQFQGASYGTMYVAAPTNTPGTRMVHGRWTDASGNFWLFGGYSSTAYADMWKFDPVANMWTWMGGSGSSSGTFSQRCIAGGQPRGRYENRASWIDACGRFWNFGGIDATNNAYSDLWFFDPSTNQFTWVSNSLTPNSPGTWGTQGVPSPSNHPPGMLGSVGFSDAQGNLWLFGGYQATTYLSYNTLWKYTPDACSSTGINVSATSSSLNGCLPFNVLFNASAPAGATLQWDFGDPSVSSDTSSASTPSYTYTNTGTFTVTLTAVATGGCASGQDTATLVITVNAVPVAVASNDIQICEGDTAALTVSGGSTYSWMPATGLDNPNSASPFASPTLTTSYVVTAANGPCTDNDTVIVSVLPLPSANVTGPFIIEPGDSVQLAASGGTTYLWSPATGLSCTSCVDPFAAPSATTIYCVLVTDTAGCESIACTEIRVELDCPEPFVPNAFSPNGDGQNDELFVRIKPGCYEQLSFLVFDRWGTLVFATEDPSIGWNGYLQGEKAMNAVYTYTLTAVMKDGSRYEKGGNVSLIR